MPCMHGEYAPDCFVALTRVLGCCQCNINVLMLMHDGKVVSKGRGAFWVMLGVPTKSLPEKRCSFSICTSRIFWPENCLQARSHEYAMGGCFKGWGQWKGGHQRHEGPGAESPALEKFIFFRKNKLI